MLKRTMTITALSLAVALVCAARLRPNPASLTPPAIAAQQGKPAAAMLHVKNVTFDSVWVEMRAGRSADCAANALVATVVLRRGRTWAVKTDEPLCWRHDAATSAAGTARWGAWTRRLLAPGQKADDTI